MKRLLYPLMLFSLILTACQEEPLQVFGEEHHIYFEKFYMDALFPGKERADSTMVSFFFMADEANELSAALVVNMTGRLLEKDRKFGLKVVPELTTARPDEYKLADFYMFRAGKVSTDATNQSDTIHIPMFRSPRLASMPQGIKLTVELIPMEDVQLGQKERRCASIVLTPEPLRPDWWDETVTQNLLGNYSPRKYRLFCRHIDPNQTLNAEMLEKATHQAIKLARAFKQWLVQHPAEAVEEDGSPMIVKV